MGTEPTPDEILEAVQRSGYLMEQEVATTLETLGLNVYTNRAFEDAQEGKSRELDVAAIQRVHFDETNRVAVMVELLCECKNSTNPFVFLMRPKTPADKHREVEEIILPRTHHSVPIPGKPNTAMSYPIVDYLKIRDMHYQSSSQLKAVQFAKIVRDKNSWSANHAGLYDSIFYPLVKALLARRKEIQKFQGEWRYVWLFFPTVVTSGSLFLLDTAAQPPQPMSTDYVTYVRQIKGAGIDGYFALDFVTQDGLVRHVNERVLPFARQVGALAQAKPEHFKK